MFLEEFNILDKFQVLNEDDGNSEKTYKLRGVFSRADVANKNKRVYRREIMEEVLNNLLPLIENGGFVGELDHPPSPKVNMEKISHKITKLTLTPDGALIGEMIPAGPRKSDLISLLEDKIRVGVSTRGVGQLKPYNGPLGEGLLEVQPGYQMKAIDIVFDPSAGTYPEAVLEDTEYERKQYLYVPSSFKAIWNDVFSK